MVCSHSRLFRPAGGATWVRRIGAGGRSALRSFASTGARLKELQRHKGDDPWIALEQLLDLNVRFADLVVMAERLHPIPFRTRP